jgi:integrase
VVTYIFVKENCITNENKIMSVSFYLLRATTERSSIMMTISYHGMVLKIASGLVCSPNNWLPVKYEVSRKENNWNDINRKLKELESTIEFELQKISVMGIFPKLQNIKKLAINARDKIVKGKDSSTSIENVIPKDVLEYFEEFIQRRNNSPDFGKLTIKHYQSVKRNLIEFASTKDIELTFDSFDRQFYDEFTSYLSYDKNLQRSTVGSIMKSVKTFLNWALEEGYSTNVKFMKALKTWRDRPETQVLTDEEIDKIEKLDLSVRPDLEDSRNIFLISIFTGFRYSDVMNLKPANIDMMSGRIKILSIKTRKESGTPIDKRLRELIQNKYPDFKLPKIDNYPLNLNIKEIAMMAGVDKPIVKTIFRGNQREELVIPKYELISSHTGRRTWNTKAEKAGKNSFAAMKAAGHSSPEVHARYVRFSLDESIDELKGIWD